MLPANGNYRGYFPRYFSEMSDDELVAVANSRFVGISERGKAIMEARWRHPRLWIESIDDWKFAKEEYRISDQWRAKKACQIRFRGLACRQCGATNRILQLHHALGYDKTLDFQEPWDIFNLECEECHLRGTEKDRAVGILSRVNMNIEQKVADAKASLANILTGITGMSCDIQMIHRSGRAAAPAGVRHRITKKTIFLNGRNRIIRIDEEVEEDFGSQEPLS